MTCRIHMDVDNFDVVICSIELEDHFVCSKDCRYFRDYDKEMSEGMEWK